MRLQTSDEVRAGAAEHAFFRDIGATMAVIGFTLTTYLSSRLAAFLWPPRTAARMCPLCWSAASPPTRSSGRCRRSRPARFMRRFLANVVPPCLKDPVRFLNDVAEELQVERVPSLAR